MQRYGLSLSGDRPSASAATAGIVKSQAKEFSENAQR
jgi:hypothetical protein